MENKNSKLSAVLAAAFALVFPPAAAGAASYQNISARIIECAENNALKKIAVLEFSAKGGAGRSDTEYAAEKIGLYLAGSKKTALIERALLEKVLKETRLSSAGDGLADKAEVLKNMLSLDAVVTGTVFSDGEKIMVMARLIELKTGRVLLAAEGEAGRLQHDALGGGFSDMEPPEVNYPDLKAEWNAAGPALPGAGYRDAVAEPGARSCTGLRSGIAELNAALVDAKARYWATKMETPGFDIRGLKRNPGSEIADPAVKARFYRLLAGYHKAGTDVRPEPEKMSAVLKLLEIEKQVWDECGVI